MRVEEHRLKRPIVQTLLAMAILSILAIFVWPTAYKYDHMKIGTNNLLVRIDRLTGKTEILYPSGWRASAGGNGTTAVNQVLALPSEQASKIDGQASITSYGWLEVNAYNGSNWRVSEITALVTVFDARGSQMLSRQYRLTPQYSGSYGLDPLSSEKFLASLGFRLDQGQTWTFRITDAKGTPALTQ
jgi:hypothetical protein